MATLPLSFRVDRTGGVGPNPPPGTAGSPGAEPEVRDVVCGCCALPLLGMPGPLVMPRAGGARQAAWGSDHLGQLALGGGGGDGFHTPGHGARRAMPASTPPTLAPAPCRTTTLPRRGR